MSLYFGDLFEYLSNTYVYLASSGQVTYASKIVKQKEARSLVERVNFIMREGNSEQQRAAQENVTFCFVELKTEGHVGDVAKLDQTSEQRDEARFIPLQKRLCEADLINLKNEIVNGPLPRGLKKRVADIDI